MYTLNTDYLFIHAIYSCPIIFQDNHSLPLNNTVSVLSTDMMESQRYTLYISSVLQTFRSPKADSAGFLCICLHPNVLSKLIEVQFSLNTVLAPIRIEYVNYQGSPTITFSVPQRMTTVFRYYTSLSSLIISGLSRDFLLSFGYLFQTDDIFELHATFEGIGSGHLPLMLHLLKNQTKTIKT